MKKWNMIIDVARCHDCNDCFLADKDEFVGNDFPPYSVAQPWSGHRWIDIDRKERGQYPIVQVAYLPQPCMHCTEAPCMRDSPAGTIYRQDNGLVIIDPEKAKGHREIVDTCPYGAIWWNEEADIAQKCIFCAHLLDDPSWAPHTTRCAHICPTDAIKTYFVEPEEMQKMIADEALEEYLPELGAKPSTLYKNLYRFTKNFVTAGVLVNEDCFEGADVTLHSKEGGIACNLFGAGVANCNDTSVLARRTTNFFGEFKFDGLKDGDYRLEIDAAGKKYSTEFAIKGESLNLGFIKL